MNPNTFNNKMAPILESHGYSRLPKMAKGWYKTNLDQIHCICLNVSKNLSEYTMELAVHFSGIPSLSNGLELSPADMTIFDQAHFETRLGKLQYGCDHWYPIPRISEVGLGPVQDTIEHCDKALRDFGALWRDELTLVQKLPPAHLQDELERLAHCPNTRDSIKEAFGLLTIINSSTNPKAVAQAEQKLAEQDRRSQEFKKTLLLPKVLLGWEEYDVGKVAFIMAHVLQQRQRYDFARLYADFWLTHCPQRYHESTPAVMRITNAITAIAQNSATTR